jgi:hypothetical protein
MSYPKTEEEVRKLYGIEESCCISCHDDVDEGFYSSMCEIYWPDMSTTEVCCAVKLGYERNKDKITFKRQFYTPRSVSLSKLLL